MCEMWFATSTFEWLRAICRGSAGTKFLSSSKKQTKGKFECYDFIIYNLKYFISKIAEKLTYFPVV